MKKLWGSRNQTLDLSAMGLPYQRVKAKGKRTHLTKLWVGILPGAAILISLSPYWCVPKSVPCESTKLLIFLKWIVKLESKKLNLRTMWRNVANCLPLWPNIPWLFVRCFHCRPFLAGSESSSSHNTNYSNSNNNNSNNIIGINISSRSGKKLFHLLRSSSLIWLVIMALPLHNPPLCLPGFLAIFLQLILSLFFCLPLLSPSLFFSFFLSLSLSLSLCSQQSFYLLNLCLTHCLFLLTFSLFLSDSFIAMLPQSLRVFSFLALCYLWLFLSFFSLTFQLSFSSLSLCSLILPFLLLPFSIHVSLIALTLSFLLHL